MAAHSLNPPGVDHAGAEHTAGLLVQATRLDGFLAGGVTDVGLGVLTRQCTHGGDHASVVLEVIIRVRDVMFLGIHVLRSDLDALVGLPHFFGTFDTLDAAAINVAAPGCVDLSQVGVITPVAGLDQLE